MTSPERPGWSAPGSSALLRERGAQVTRAHARSRARAGAAGRRSRRVALGPAERAGARRGAGGPRRRRAPRRRARRAALERAGQARDPRQPRDRARATWSRGCAPAAEPAPARARQLLGDRLLRAARRRAARRGGAARARTSWREVCVAWESEAAASARSSACAWCRSAPGSCSTAPAARSGRCCRRSGSASAARWRAGASTSPGSTPTTSCGMMLAALEDERWSGPVNATAPEPRHQPRVLAARSDASCTAPRSLPVPGARAAAALRRDGRDRHHRRPRGARQGRWCSATSSRHPQLERGAARGARASASARSTGFRAASAAVLGLDDHAAGPLAQQVGGGRADAAARRRARGSSTSRSRREPTRSASSTSAEPGLRVRIRPVWILMPAPPGLDARALEHRAPVRLLLLEARLERQLARAPAARRSRTRRPPRRSAWRRCCSADALTSSPKIGTSAVRYSSSSKSAGRSGRAIR